MRAVFVFCALALLAADARAQSFRLVSGEDVEGEIAQESEGFYIVKSYGGETVVILKSELEPAEVFSAPPPPEAAQYAPKTKAKEPVVPQAGEPNAKAEPAEIARPWLRGQKGYKRAVEAQKETGRPLLIYFYTDWCPYCRKFASNVLRTSEVRKALRRAIKVQINGDDKEPVMGTFRVRGYPSLYILSASGQTSQMSTRTTPAEFIKQCRKLGLIE